MNNVLSVASYTANYSAENNYACSYLRLQLLLYFIQVQFIRETGKTCFDDRILAVDTGPWIRKIYENFWKYGALDIYQFDKEKYHQESISDNDKALINDVIENLSCYSTTALRKVVQHQSPWMDAYSKGNKTEITCESIRKYFCN